MKNKTKTGIILGMLLLSFFPLVQANEWYLDDGRCNIGEPCSSDCSGYTVDGLDCVCFMGICETVTESYSFIPFPWVDYNAGCQYVEPVAGDGICNWGEQCSEDCLGYKTCTSFSCIYDNMMCAKYYHNGWYYGIVITNQEGLQPETYKIVCEAKIIPLPIREVFYKEK